METLGHDGNLIKSCGRLAIEKGFDNFGIQYYGGCFYGNDPDLSEEEVTTDDDCDKLCKWDIGGPNSMVVYNLVWVDTRAPPKAVTSITGIGKPGTAPPCVECNE